LLYNINSGILEKTLLILIIFGALTSCDPGGSDDYSPPKVIVDFFANNTYVRINVSESSYSMSSSYYNTTYIFPSFTKTEYREVKYISSLMKHQITKSIPAYSDGYNIKSLEDDSLILTYSYVPKADIEALKQAAQKAGAQNVIVGDYNYWITRAENRELLYFTFPNGDKFMFWLGENETLFRW
jgi:hypothetical protein